MKTGFIGAGKAGTSLGKYFTSKGIPVSGYFSKSFESSKQAADFTKSTAFSNLEDLITKSDMIFITTPDGIIGQMAEELSKEKYNLEGKYLCHISGSQSSGVLLCATLKSASAHPMIAISSKETDLSQAFFTMEGDKETVSLLESIFSKCGNGTAKIDTDKKGIYHCAAGIASNLMIALGQISLKMLEDCGFEEKEALELLAPLMRNNIEALCEKGPAEALTGPIERADVETVEKHLGCFAEVEDETGGKTLCSKSDFREIYRLLSLELIEIAREKNKNRNYNQMKELLEEK